MSSADWIAIAAICSSLLIAVAGFLVSVVGFFFNYMTNKENIKARRAEIVTEKSIEIVTEKSIEVYRELLEYIGLLRINIALFKRKLDTTILNHTLSRASDLQSFIVKNFFYLPYAISDDLLDTIETIRVISKVALEERGEKLVIAKEWDSVLKTLNRLTTRAQNHLEVKVKENPTKV